MAYQLTKLLFIKSISIKIYTDELILIERFNDFKFKESSFKKGSAIVEDTDCLEGMFDL